MVDSLKEIEHLIKSAAAATTTALPVTVSGSLLVTLASYQYSSDHACCCQELPTHAQNLRRIIDCIDYVTGIGNAHAHNGVHSVLRLG